MIAYDEQRPPVVVPPSRIPGQDAASDLPFALACISLQERMKPRHAALALVGFYLTTNQFKHFSQVYTGAGIDGS